MNPRVQFFAPNPAEDRHKDLEADGVPKFSASALGTFRKCRRKWACSKVSGLPKVETQPQADGKRGHTYAENFLNTGKIPDQTDPIGRLMVEGIPHLPKPGTAECEPYFTAEVDGITFHGFIDFRVRLPVLVGDHKFSSDPKTWGLNEETIFEDEQANIYGLAVCVDGDVEDCEVRWVYYDKRKRRAFPVSVRFKRAQALAWIQKNLVPRAQEMLLIRQVLETEIGSGIDRVAACNKVQNNPLECHGIGKNCDYAAKCHLYPTKEQKMDQEAFKKKLAEIQAKKAGTSGTPPEAAKALEATAKEVAGEAEAAPANSAPTESTPPAAKTKGTKAAKDAAPAATVANVTNVGLPTSGPLARLLAGESVTLTAILTLK